MQDVRKASEAEQATQKRMTRSNQLLTAVLEPHDQARLLQKMCNRVVKLTFELQHHQQLVLQVVLGMNPRFEAFSAIIQTLYPEGFEGQPGGHLKLLLPAERICAILLLKKLDAML